MTSMTPPGFDTRRLGERIRALRSERGWSLRALAERIGISASALSQMERGKMRPSVTRLYQIMTELDVPMAALFGEEEVGGAALHASGREPAGRSRADRPEVPGGVGEGGGRTGLDSFGDLGDLDNGGHVVSAGDVTGGNNVVAGGEVSVTRRADAATLELEHGVRYRRLTPEAVPGMNYFESVYPPGSCSSQNAEYVRHRGHEIGNVVSGTLTVDVGFESYELGPGDSIMYPSALPHRITNRGAETAVAIWLNLTHSPGPPAPSSPADPTAPGRPAPGDAGGPSRERDG